MFGSLRYVTTLLLVFFHFVNGEHAFFENNMNINTIANHPTDENINHHHVTLVLIGATGNLAQKYLWKSIFDLLTTQPSLRVIAGATQPQAIGSAKLHNIWQKSIPCKDSQTCQDTLLILKRRTKYVQLYQEDHYVQLAQTLEDKEGSKEIGRLFYLAISPEYYEQTIRHIHQHCRPSMTSNIWLRVVIEKPFGKDFESATEMKKNLQKYLKEDEIYLMDHYLGKNGVHVIEKFRIANQLILEPYWNDRYISNVLITLNEMESCEGRARFYDAFGVVRDVMQNHMTTIAGLIAMELKDDKQSTSTEQRRKHLIKMIHRHPQDRIVYGQYEDYLQHLQSDQPDKTKSMTPTAASIKLRIDNQRWKNTPIILSSGKALAKREAHIQILFKQSPSGMRFNKTCSITFTIQDGSLGGEAIEICPDLPKPSLPDGWRYQNDFRLVPSTISPLAYDTLLKGVLVGDKSMFIETEEAIASWKLWTHILRDDTTSMYIYPKKDNSFINSSHIDVWGYHIHPTSGDLHVVSKTTQSTTFREKDL